MTIDEQIAELRKQVFARKISCTEFDFQSRLLRGKVTSREEYNAQLKAEAAREAAFIRNVAKYLD